MAISNTATATSTALTRAAINANLLAANPSTSSNANQVQNQGKAESSQGKTNPPQGFEGPSTGLPGVNKPSTDSLAPKTAADKQASVDQALGLVSKADAIKSLAGVGTASTAASSAKDKLTDLAGSSKTDKPAFDQGFGSPSVTLGVAPMAGQNPMAAYQGQAIGGVLGAVAAIDVKVPPASSGAAGSGLVSGFWSDAKAWLTGSDKPKEDKKENGKESYPGATSAANATTNPDGEVEERNPTKEASADKEWQNKLFLEKLSEVMTGMSNWDGTLTEKGKALEQARKADAGMPNPENTGSNVNILTQSMLNQIIASKAGKPTSQGGSGDVTPVTEGGIDLVVRDGSIAVNESSLQQQKLVGTPLPPGMGNSGGGTSAPKTYTGSNGAGVTNPGFEAGSPSGDPRYLQDPGAALSGNKPAPQFPPAGGGSQDNVSSSVSTTLADGARNLTLTGSQAINGTGNALDNRIIGNQAANELRGGAGDDNLDGQAGNDLLDGGDGRDVLTGGLGADRFRFATAGAFGTAQADRITDFSRSEGDRIELSRSAFGLSAGATLSFQTVNNDADLTRALGSSTLLIQDLRTGSILFNQNGTAAGAGQGGVFATVNQGITLQGSDFALGA